MWPRIASSSEDDCGTIDGIYVSALMEGGEIIETAGERVLGRVVLEEIRDPFTGEVLVNANQEIDEALAKKIDDAGIEKVNIRSVLTCKSRHGVCAMCYGRDLSHGHLVNIGEAVGIIAAQSIGEPGTQLTMRTFHIGGTAKFEEHSTLESRHDGIIRFVNLNTVKSRSGGLVVMNRNGEVHVLDEQERSRGKYPVPYGAHIKVEDGSRVKGPRDQKRGDLIAEWDPFSIPILAEVDGTVKFGDIIEGKTMQEQVDEVTGLSRKVIVEFKGTDMRPRVSIKDKKGKTAKVPGSERGGPAPPVGRAPTSSSRKGIRSTPATSSPRFPGKRPRRRISRAVFPAWRNCSRRASRRSLP